MYQKYLAEGEKIILELLEFNPSLIDQLFATPEFINTYGDKIIAAGIETNPVNVHELERISNLSTPQKACAIVRMPDENFLDITSLPFNKVLYLDEVRDPGNMGTIIRSADWFGWDMILLSPDCVDPYNPKVVQSAMGSLFRVKIREMELKAFQDESKNRFTTYAAEMVGESIYEINPEYPIVLIMGNESHGIRVNSGDRQIHPVSIPRYNRQTESLNVGIACSIIMAEWNRRNQ
jgi:RNA methyltransferase, TrmH family